MTKTALKIAPILAKKNHVIGVDGKVLSVHTLPPPNTQRWTASRKANVVLAIVGGLITMDQALDRYPTSSAEEWNRDVELYKQHDLLGLKVTRLQKDNIR